MNSIFSFVYRRLDPWLFSSHRADYFNYLHAVLSGSEGRLTIRELFYRDASRYGNNYRGRISARWAKSCEVSGGDLYATWLGYFPIDELLLVRVTQGFGNQRLLNGFKALSNHLDLLIETRRILLSTMGAGVVAVLIMLLLVLLVPWWTIPALQQSFNGLPDIYLGSWASNLFFFAAIIKKWGLILACVVALLLITVLVSMPVFVGYFRDLLDKFGIWRLYRQINALRFFSLIVILLQPGVGISSQLRSVVVVFQEGSSQWLGRHIQKILNNIDQGVSGAEAFDTGLLDRDLYWFLTDMAMANGLQAGLDITHQRMTDIWIKQVKYQAQLIRWLCLLCGVVFILGMGLWHYAAIDDLRRAWMMFHSV